MIVNGTEIASAIYAEIKQKLSGWAYSPRLVVFTCAPNAETRKFLELKRRRANELGITVDVVELPPDIKESEAVATIETRSAAYDGVVVQLPFPAHLNPDSILKAVPRERDLDVLDYRGEETDILPPVIGAISEISKKHEVTWTGKNVVVVGQGRLVGRPAAFWARAANADVTVIDKNTLNAAAALRQADVIISGAGVPGLITPDKIKEGAAIFDAGTSEEGGVLRGDADPACAEKASLFTPVPGGIGPITIAVLLRNLVRSIEARSET